MKGGMGSRMKTRVKKNGGRGVVKYDGEEKDQGRAGERYEKRGRKGETSSENNTYS